MKNPFNNGPSKDEKRYQQDLKRWSQMAEAIEDRAGLAVLRSQPKEVVRLTGPRIEESFNSKVKNSGQIFPIEEKDHMGRDVTRYYGDIKAGFAESLLPAVPFRMAELVHFDGRTFVKGQEPPGVQRAMLLRRNGFAE